MTRKLIKELADPYSKSLPKLPKTAGSVVSGQAEEEPGFKPIVSDYNPDGTIRPASAAEVAQRLDLDPKNISCIQDLANNWIHYSAMGLLIAASTAPILLPLINLPRNFITSRGNNIVKIGKKFADIFKPVNIPKIPAKVFGAVKGVGKWYAKPFTDVYDVLKNAKGFSKLGAVPKAGVGAVKFVKNSFLVALVLTIAYEGFGLKKFFDWGSDLDDELFSVTFKSIDIVIQYLIKMDMAAERLALYANRETNPDCVMTNAIASTVMATFIVNALAGGKHRALYELDDVKALKSGDDLAAFTAAKKEQMIANFLSDVNTATKSLRESAGVSDKIFRKYIEILGKGKDAQKAAEAGLKYLKSKNIQNAEKFHKSALSEYGKVEARYIKQLNKQAADANQAITSFKEGKEMKQANKLGEALIERARITKKSFKMDPRFASSAGSTANKADDFTQLSFPGIGAVDDVVAVAAGEGKVVTIQQIMKGVDDIEIALTKGQIGLRQAASLYSRGFSKNLSKFSKELAKTLDLPADVSKLSTAQRVEKLVESLNTLSREDKKLGQALKLMDPKGVGSGSVSNQGILRKVWNSRPTRGAAKAADTRKLYDARKATQTAMEEVLKLNKKLSPDDLTRIEKAVEEAYVSIKRASGAGVATRTGDLARLGAGVVTAGALAALTGVIARTLFVEDTDDLETWQGTQIARALAWDGIIPAAAFDLIYLNPVQLGAEFLGFEKDPDSAEKTYHKALLQLIKEILSSDVDGNGNVRIMKEIFEKVIFDPGDKYTEQLISKIAKQDVNELDAIEIVNEFRKSKSEYSQIMYKLFINLGINEKGLGLASLSPGAAHKAYRKMWHPVLISIMVANSGLITRLNSLEHDTVYNNLSEEQKKKYLREKVFKFINPEDVTKNLADWTRTYVKMVNNKSQSKLNEELIMKENNKKVNSLLEELVKEAINENYGKGYNPYPYHSHIGMEDEESPDFQQDWKDFELSLVRDETRDTAIRVAKILVKDLELFGDVLDLVGKNQSVATEILKNLRKNEENS